MTPTADLSILSLITKARHGGGPYVYSLLTGYTNQTGYKNEKGVELLKKYPQSEAAQAGKERLASLK